MRESGADKAKMREFTEAWLSHTEVNVPKHWKKDFSEMCSEVYPDHEASQGAGDLEGQDMQTGRLSDLQQQLTPRSG
jgi:hypothetical protein